MSSRGALEWPWRRKAWFIGSSGVPSVTSAPLGLCLPPSQNREHPFAIVAIPKAVELRAKPLPRVHGRVDEAAALGTHSFGVFESTQGNVKRHNLLATCFPLWPTGDPPGTPSQWLRSPLPPVVVSEVRSTLVPKHQAAFRPAHLDFRAW